MSERFEPFNKSSIKKVEQWALHFRSNRAVKSKSKVRAAAVSLSNISVPIYERTDIKTGRPQWLVLQNPRLVYFSFANFT